jgi:AcrR family transcriptional regulator
MARPRDIEKTRELALRAVAVLERDGLTISAEHLARELGLKRPTLLYHFPTHGHIVELALAELLLEQAAHVSVRVEAKTHPIDRLYARLLAIDEFHVGREGRLLFLTQAVALTGGRRVGEILAAASGLFDAARQDMVDRVVRGVEEGIVHPCDAVALVALLRSIIDGLTIQRVTSPASVERVHAMVWKHVLEPLKRKKPKSLPKRTSRRK